MYNNTSFKVRMGENESEWKEQQRGIRQGCPLSPYLFLVVMTKMYQEVEDRLNEGEAVDIPAGFRKWNILYADDTVIFADSHRQVERILKIVEEIAETYGMRLNEAKCEVIQYGNRRDIKFRNGRKVEVKEEVKYLGCRMNRKCDMKKELKTRVADTMAVMKNWGYSGHKRDAR